MGTFIFYANNAALYTDVVLSVALTGLLLWVYVVSLKYGFTAEMYLRLYEGGMESLKNPQGWYILLPVLMALSAFGHFMFLTTYVIGCASMFVYLKYKSNHAINVSAKC